jgi:hypothetical protein
MRLFGKQAGRRRKQTGEAIYPEVVEHIGKAIAIITDLSGQVEDNEILEAFRLNKIQEPYASRLLVFLPIAACRLMLPDVCFVDDYVEIDRLSKKSSKKKFSESVLYTAVVKEVDEYFSSRPGGDNVLKIAGRSAEFRVINDLLNCGGKLEGIRLTAMVLRW